MKQAWQWYVVGISLAMGAPALAAEANPRRAALERSTEQLDALVQKAHGGQLSPEQLRARRRRLEARLNHELSTLPADMKPGDIREVTVSKAEMNQAVIQSQEFEFFGPEDRPEWGWFPSKAGKGTGSALIVDPDGRTRYSPSR
jgi:hypothetical protein